MPLMKGRCACDEVQYTVSLGSADEARTSLCHCSSCKRAFGTDHGLTTKVPVESYSYTKGVPRQYTQDNGVVREFCRTCGTFLCEYGEQAADKFRYLVWGTLDEKERDMVPPKGEFFCSQRAKWMPEIPGVFHKQEIKE
ncbi:hypothetical protein SODALDRAFT_284099 [Sodiomyces alkalinus F11]|uniref:CENP-V/GFA domain-containing protein n=1 Tax=Sodiomyces alkalinus (strain CBS 110278 / VKM F-3762 / F11) TaxID=1314773 RepID=A0A3N2PL52_SODAK|nr:hypothetical protein SODALDRAFT_284099 [Sodiomyces alkalinus F11]ROT35247.1 hypothetical protein SODALDRAFT_284099 [Sodiomyces alkalinus F11]